MTGVCFAGGSARLGWLSLRTGSRLKREMGFVLGVVLGSDRVDRGTCAGSRLREVRFSGRSGSAVVRLSFLVGSYAAVHAFVREARVGYWVGGLGSSTPYSTAPALNPWGRVSYIDGNNG